MSTIEAASKDTIGIIERLYKTETLFLLISITLYIDCILKIFCNKNIIIFDWSSVNDSSNIPNMFLLLLTFTIFASFIIPIINGFIICIFLRIRKLPKIEDNYRHYVMYHQVRQYAECSNNDILMSWCKSTDVAEQKSDLLSKYSFSAILFTCFNFMLGANGTKTILVYINSSYELLYDTVLKSIDGHIFSTMIAYLVAAFIYGSFYIVLIFGVAIWYRASFFNKYDHYLWNDELAKILNKEKFEAEAKKRERSVRTHSVSME